MFTPDQYSLLDFGVGRRLERFGGVLLDRPCPAAEKIPLVNPGAWDFADARYEESGPDQGSWLTATELPERWTVSHRNLLFELKCTPQGQVGLFPEQAENWDWLGRNAECGMMNDECTPSPRSETGVSEQGASTLGSQLSPLGSQLSPLGSQLSNHDSPLASLKVLNLFAYTGGSTLAAAAAGAEVAHVDAAKNLVAWARRNAELSGLTDHPIRWICEDAVKFCKRELRRGNFYDAVILDPPSYGHGPHGEVWRLSQHLPHLLELCAELTAGRCRFILLTCHTPGFGPERLTAMLRDHFFCASDARIEAGPLVLRDSKGRELPGGAVIRWRSPLSI
jgi:23S rRNA (cytosine1962-C5)-methyltransferase